MTIPLSKLNTGTIKKWLLEQIQNNQLSDRKFKELKSIINMMFDYATSFDLIQVNLARQVRGFSKNLFTIPATKSLSEIIYSSEKKRFN